MNVVALMDKKSLSGFGSNVYEGRYGKVGRDDDNPKAGSGGFR